MRYTKYGRTGNEVSAVGFGGMRFNMELSNEENSRLLDYAFEHGINYFDTAPGYCDDQSETIFGHALKRLPREKIFVSTKLMPGAIKNSAEARAKVLESLRKLQTGYIDYFHVWCLRKMAHFEDAMRPDGLYEELLRCQQDGLIRHIVFSSHQTGADIRKIIATGKFAGALMGINILNFPYREEGINAAAEHGLGVVAMNPLAGGLIPQHADKLKFLAIDGGSPVETALRFIIHHPKINIALPGITTREHIDMACRIADMPPLAETEITRIRACLGSEMNKVCTACGYCLNCPQKVPIASYMQFFNAYQMFGIPADEMIKQIPFQHDWGILADRQADAVCCTGCGHCEEACTQHLNIIERLKTIAGWEKHAAKE